MIDYEKTLLDIVKPMVDQPENLSVKQMESLNDEEILLYVYASSADIARLIGRQGSMANSIRQMMSVVSCLGSKKITIKFESY